LKSKYAIKEIFDGITSKLENKDIVRRKRENITLLQSEENEIFVKQVTMNRQSYMFDRFSALTEKMY
jgi:hypothetical protein